MKNAQVKQVLQQVETRIKRHDGKGALGTPPVPKRPGLTHGPVGIGPTAPHKTIRR